MTWLIPLIIGWPIVGALLEVARESGRRGRIWRIVAWPIYATWEAISLSKGASNNANDPNRDDARRVGGSSS